MIMFAFVSPVSSKRYRGEQSYRQEGEVDRQLIVTSVCCIDLSIRLSTLVCVENKLNLQNVPDL